MTTSNNNCPVVYTLKSNSCPSQIGNFDLTIPAFDVTSTTTGTCIVVITGTLTANSVTYATADMTATVNLVCTLTSLASGQTVSPLTYTLGQPSQQISFTDFT